MLAPLVLTAALILAVPAPEEEENRVPEMPLQAISEADDVWLCSL